MSYLSEIVLLAKGAAKLDENVIGRSRIPNSSFFRYLQAKFSSVNNPG
jgi:hypothetical protein